MSSMADRILIRMSDLGITQADIKRGIGAGKATISSWVNGDTKPSGAYATKLAFYLRCNTDWLLSGVGRMNSTFEVNESQKGIPNNTAKVPLDYGMDSMDGMMPVISWVAASSFCNVVPVTIDDVTDWIARPQYLSKHAFGLVIQGRSMWPEFKPDEIIYIEPEIGPWDLKDGDLIITHCNDDKQATFKQLVIGDGPDDMYLKLLNPDWPDQKMVSMRECSLVGIVDSKFVRYR